jgi:hypothetical protein
MEMYTIYLLLEVFVISLRAQTRGTLEYIQVTSFIRQKRALEY